MADESDTERPPRWDLSALYPSLVSNEFQTEYDEWVEQIARLRGHFDAAGIGAMAEPQQVDESTVRTADATVEGLNSVSERGHKLYAFVTGFVATDSRNAEAQLWMSRLQIQMAELDKLNPRFAAWVGMLDLDDLASRSETAKTHAYALRQAQISAQHLMTPAEEDLSADLNLTGGRAWSKLYNTFSSQITAEVELSGTMRTLPLTAVRNLAYDADRGIRRRAFEAELAAWRRNAVPIAAALNSIKGQTNTLSIRRHWTEPLDVALFGNAIDRATLEAMMDAARGHFADFRRYLNAKAKLLGISRCAWYDLFAPVSALSRSWSFGSARQFITSQFASFSPSLSGLATRAFAESWIDAEPRDGKRGGAFCMWAQAGESRILSNFQASYGGMSTLAHELGHGYHNLCLAQRSALQRQTPMTLAETASTFCQIIVRDAALRDADADEQLAILEADLQDNTQVVVDISSRFLFETEVFSRRRERELSPDEFCTIMTDSQLATYGDSLDPDTLHPYMWAVKPHYYGSVFYNFPYMFGLLFALGIYARFRESAAGFVQRYESLLAATGMEDAATLARRFGIDLTQPAFWEGSLSLIAADIDRFEQLAKSAKPQSGGSPR